MSEVSEALVLYELGGIIQQPHNYSVRQVYDLSDKSTPIIFIQPGFVDNMKQGN